MILSLIESFIANLSLLSFFFVRTFSVFKCDFSFFTLTCYHQFWVVAFLQIPPQLISISPIQLHLANVPLCLMYHCHAIIVITVLVNDFEFSAADNPMKFASDATHS